MRKIKLGSRFIGGIIVLIVVAVVISCFDGGKRDKIIGTWSYSKEWEYDDEFTVDVVMNLEFDEDTYRWYIDEEKTEKNLNELYDRCTSYYGITEEQLREKGYESVESYKQVCLTDDMETLKKWVEEEEPGGTWRITNGKFVFTVTGDSEQYYNEFTIDGDILVIKGTESMELTKVS